MRRELLAGCGSRGDKILHLPGMERWQGLVRLDLNADHLPDVCADLNDPLPFRDESFDEVHLYECLEHLGQQGDAARFFAEFAEYHRVLKPDGLLLATVPSWQSEWAWGDPSHRRVLTPGTLVFLSQGEYDRQVGQTAMSDFRHLWRRDFETVYQQDDGQSFRFVLQKKGHA